MTSEGFQKIMRVIWEQSKPLLRFLLTVTVIMSIAILIMLFVGVFNLQDEAFLILVTANISILTIFLVGLIIVGVRHVFTSLTKGDEITCRSCGEDITGGSNICTNCGKDNRKFTDSA